jgi:5S rRNA maturation endonuclease (ribonuclease M5)
MKNPLTAPEVSTYYHCRYPDLRQAGKEWRGLCRVHGGKNPNFVVKPDSGEWYCHSKCGRGGSVVDLEMALSGTDFKTAVAEIEQLVGRPQKVKSKIVATYDYVDEAGKLLSQAVRFEPKDFRQRRPDGRGGWIWKTKGTRRVLYHLPQLKDADQVLVVEGEKDVHSAERLGFTATCNAEGAGKWRPDFADTLAGKSVVVVPDNDEPGRKHTADVVRSLRGKACEVRVVSVPTGKDLTDWIAAGATKETIDSAIAAAPVVSDIDQAQAEPAVATGSGPQKRRAGLPDIIVSNRQLRDLRDEGLEAIVAANCPPWMFVREGRLVDLRFKGDGHLIINDLTDVHLRGHLTNVASFFVETDFGRKPCPPPLYLPKDLLGYPRLHEFIPGIVGLTEIPVLRPDGTVLSELGWDPKTRLYYAPQAGFSIPPVPDAPSDADMERALQLIDSAIGDFPFLFDLDADGRLLPADRRQADAVISASKANALAAMLTPVVRPAITGPTPLALIDAPAAGTGKTLLAEAVSIIATGREAALFSAPGEEEEWRKQVTSYLREGVGVIVIDNVAGRLESAQLAKALTAVTWADRILGQSQTVLLPVLCTWIATGNNIQVGGDLPRRCYWIRLDAQTATPYLRTGFRHPNLRRWVAENRGELVAALLTIARAWFAAGKPKPQTPTLGSYESWSETMGGILAHAGVRGFLANSVELQQQAETATDASATLCAISAVTRGGRFTSADLHSLCRHDASGLILIPALPSALRDAVGESGLFERRLGRWLAAHADRRFGPDEIHIKRAGVMHNVQLWRIVTPACSEAKGGPIQ